MNMLKALFFPGTKISGALAENFLRLLENLIYYQVIEDDEDEGGSLPERCRPRTPVPLGSERERFVRMIADLKANRAEYYGGQLSSIVAASRYDTDESSVWSLVSRIHGGEKREGHKENFTDKLWQARLVLKLAEIIVQEESEVSAALSAVSRKEQDLFGALHGELAEPDADELPPLNQLTGRSVSLVGEKMLMAAWGCLYALDPEENNFLVTDSESCGGLLLDTWAAKAGKEPERLFEIGLPEEKNEAFIPGLSQAKEDLKRAMVSVGSGGPATVLPEAGAVYQQVLSDNEVEPDVSCEIFQLAGYPVRDVFAGLSGVKPVRISDRCMVGIFKSRR